MKHFENFKLAMQFLASESAYSMDDTDIFIHKYIRDIWSKTSEVVHELLLSLTAWYQDPRQFGPHPNTSRL